MPQSIRSFRVYDTSLGGFIEKPKTDPTLYASTRYMIDYDTGIIDINGRHIFQRDIVQYARSFEDITGNTHVTPYGEPFMINDFVFGKLVFRSVIATAGTIGFEGQSVGSTIVVVGQEHIEDGGLI